MAVEQTATDTSDSFHGRFADDGDIRIESSSLLDSGETPQQTLDRVKTERAAERPASEPTSFDPPADAPPPADGADPAAPTETADKGADPKPKKGTLRWRHDELRARVHASTRELHEVRGQLDAETKRLAELKAQAEALAAGKAPASGDGKAAPTQPAPADDPKPTWSAYEDAGKTFDEFTDDRDAWVQRQTLREIRAEQDRIAADQRERDAQTRTEAQEREADERSRARVREIVQTLHEDPEVAAAMQDPEFLDMPQTTFMGALVKLHANGPDVLRHLALHPADGYAFATLEMTPPIMEAFKGTDDPVRLLAALANNVPEAKRIARLSPYQAMKALAALEGSASPGAKSGTPAATNRPPQPSPLPARVGARSAATVSSLADLAKDTDNADEYFRRRLAGEDVSA